MACLNEICFLCKDDVSESIEKKKRKKLFGEAASEYRSQIDIMSEEIYGISVSSTIPASMKASSYVCSRCLSSVANRSNYLLKAEAEKRSILNKLEQYHTSRGLIQLPSPEVQDQVKNYHYHHITIAHA